MIVKIDSDGVCIFQLCMLIYIYNCGISTHPRLLSSRQTYEVVVVKDLHGIVLVRG